MGKTEKIKVLESYIFPKFREKEQTNKIFVKAVSRLDHAEELVAPIFLRASD
jgi:hypothetical protein